MSRLAARPRAAALKRRNLLTAAGVLLLASCSDPDHALFVTSTQVGIDGDGKTQSANIGYDRYEGFVGPAYRNGGVPPVMARIESNLSVVSPKVKQVYATGQAARIVSDEDGTEKPKKKALAGERRLMFFGTSSNFGLKAAFNTQGLGSVNVGYKRQEFSFIPIGKQSARESGTSSAAAAPTAEEESRTAMAEAAPEDGAPAAAPVPPVQEGEIGAPPPERPGEAAEDTAQNTGGGEDSTTEDVYGSVLAALDLDVSVKSVDTTRAGMGQFFATGDAAEYLASRSDIKQKFMDEAESALTAREITCENVDDANGQKLRDWIKSSDNPTASAQVLVDAWQKEFNERKTLPEILRCDTAAAKRGALVEKYGL